MGAERGAPHDEAIDEAQEDQPAAASGPALRWSVHPLLRDLRRGLLLGVAFLLIWFAVDAALGLDGLLVAMLATIVPLAYFLFPSEYTLSDEGVSQKVIVRTGVKTWDRFIGYTVYPDGALVAYDPYILRNRITKGVFLFFQENRDDVIAILECHLPGEGYYAPNAGDPPEGLTRANPPSSTSETENQG